MVEEDIEAEEFEDMLQQKVEVQKELFQVSSLSIISTNHIVFHFYKTLSFIS